VSTKIRKIYLLKSNNSPYLSGDVFADNADVSVFESKTPFRFCILERISVDTEPVACDRSARIALTIDIETVSWTCDITTDGLIVFSIINDRRCS
jgi:hypothetical protein